MVRIFRFSVDVDFDGDGSCKGVVHNRVCLYSVSGNGGDGGWGDFELVSKSEKVRKCLKNKN